MGIRSLSTASISTGAKRSKVWDQSATIIEPNSFESIASYVIGSGGNTDVTFSSIPQTFKHLQLRIAMRTIATGGAVAIATLNGDTGTNYSSHTIDSYGYRSEGGGPYSGATASTGRPAITFALSNVNSGVSITDFYDYTNTSKFKSFRGWTGSDNNGT